MGSLTCLTDPAIVVVADASTMINLTATGYAREIARVLPNRLVVADIVRAELDAGRPRGRRDAERLDALLAAGLIEIVSLDDRALQPFEALVVGHASETLDDGEAATIAYAAAHAALALTDDRKAIRICAERFPALQVGCTVDLFAHPEVERALGREMLTDAVLNALHGARMRVLPHHLDWVVELIGADQAALCPSLPKSVRKR